MPFETIILVLTIIATAVMAASGALQGVRQGFDPFGTVVLAIATAVGGGTVRDMLIGATPAFWLQDLTYLLVAIPTGLLAHFIGQRLASGGGKRLALLLYLDAIGLALFTLVGVEVALTYELTALPAIILGCVTGVVGGMLRDVLSGLTPSILSQDLYATISLAGGALYLFGNSYLPHEVSLIGAFILMVIARFIVIWRQA